MATITNQENPMVRAATRAATPRYRVLSRSVRQRVPLCPGGPARDLWVPQDLDDTPAPSLRETWRGVRRTVVEVEVEAGGGYPAEQWVVQVIGCRRLTDAAVRTGARGYVRDALQLSRPITVLAVPPQRTVGTRPETRTLGDVPRGTHPPVVYVLRNGTRVKIGTTTNLRERVHRLALRLEDVVFAAEGGRELEQALHQRFASQRVGDTEWFTETGALAEFIATQTGASQ